MRFVQGKRRRVPPAFARGGATACALAAFLSLLPLAQAQPPPPLVLNCEFARVPPRRPRVAFAPMAKAPELDGDLRDECWSRCAANAIGSDMPDGVPSRESSVRICRDERNLYVAFDLREPSIGEIPLVKKPLTGVWSEENAQLWLSLSEAGEDFLLFAADPNGSSCAKSLRDAAQWSPEWEVKSARTAEGWSAEMAIPLKSLGVRRIEGGESWRVNFCRDIAATGERCSWEPAMGNRANPAAWGVLFFGDVTAYEKRPAPPRIALHVARAVVGARDARLYAVVRIEPAAAELAKSRLRIALAPAEESAAPPGEEKPLPAPAVFAAAGERASLVLNVADLPPGEFILRAELVRTDGAVLARAEAPLKKPASPALPAPPPGKLNILVHPLPTNAKAAASWPMTAGAALPPGALHSPEKTRLLAPDGKPVPCAVSARRRRPGDGSICWLGLDFRADAARGGRYTLEYGPQVTPPAPHGFTRKIQAMRMDLVADAWVMDTGDAWWVNTGALLFNVNRRRFTGVEGAWVDVNGDGHYDWTEQILNSDPRGSGPYITDSEGRAYRLAADPDATVELEEFNELGLTIRAEGRLVPLDLPAALDAGRCVLRITAFLGQPFLRVRCAFILNERAAHRPLSDIGIAERLDFNKGFDAVFGASEPYRRPIRETGTVFLLKLIGSRAIIRNLKDPPTVDERADAQNWAAAAAPDRALAVALRDMDRLCPKELELTAEGRLVLHFWPPHGEALRRPTAEPNRRTVGALGFAASGRFLDLRVPPEYAGALNDRDGLDDYDAVRNMDVSDPTGLALTYDMLYLFTRGAFDAAEVAEVVRAFELCPAPVQDPDSLAASGALDDILPPPRLERALAMAARLLEMEDRAPAQGEFNYMDLHRNWRPDEQRWALRNCWMGADHDLPAALWRLYLQTGRPEIFLAARRNLRHVLSADICRDAPPSFTALADPRRRKIVGAFGDHKTPLHWQSASSVSDRHARVGGILLAYYLTGDPLARDTALLWAQAAANYGPPTSGCDGMAYINNLREVLSLRHDPALLERLGESADHLFRMPLDIRQTERWIPGLRAYLAQTGDSRAAAWLRRLAAAMNADADRIPPISLWRDLYAAGGDPAHQQRADALIADLENRACDAPQFSWEDFCSYVHGAGEPTGR